MYDEVTSDELKGVVTRWYRGALAAESERASPAECGRGSEKESRERM